MYFDFIFAEIIAHFELIDAKPLNERMLNYCQLKR